MKLKPLQKSVYNIATVVFLVLALGVISIITSVNNKNSEELSTVVTDLTQNKYEIDKIDEAIQLLYKAENNSRLYILTRNKNKYTDYVNQLERVSSLIFSIQQDDDKEQIDELVKDKINKTELYISARLLVDSLIRNEPTQTNTLPKDAQNKGASKLIIEKKTVEQVVDEGSKKKLFGRLKDAIVNKSDQREVKSITTTEDQIQHITNEAESITPPLTIASKSNQSTFDKLSEKEKALLVSNNLLFEELKNLLENLKLNEAAIHNQRQLSLGNNANILMDNLKSINKYNLILSLILTIVILSILLLLYRNMQALQSAKLKAEEYADYKSKFVATLSHEIRTPLHSIHAFTDELSKRNKENGESEIIDAIKLSSNMLIAVVNNILDFTKMESGKFKLNYVPFNPSTIIQEVIFGLTIQAKRKNLALLKQLEASTNTEIYGDAFQFRQLLINLISNSIKYSEQGSVTVSANFNTTDNIKGILEVKIKDTGIGIHRDRLPTIFEEYNSQENESEIKDGSTGLGLSIVKRIVDYHKGEINVTSELGTGTTFIIKLPYDIFLEKNTNSFLTSENQGNPKILIVENDKLNIKILNLLFTNENFTISNAFNGKEALEDFIKNDYDLMITDISMPGLNGFELARKIRELPDPKKSSVPIIAITGFQEPDDLHLNERSDINAWLMKPFEKEELLSTINKLRSLPSNI